MEKTTIILDYFSNDVFLRFILIREKYYLNPKLFQLLQIYHEQKSFYLNIPNFILIDYLSSDNPNIVPNLAFSLR